MRLFTLLLKALLVPALMCSAVNSAAQQVWELPDLVERVIPSVVRIRIGYPVNDKLPPGPDTPRATSGFIVSGDGYIVTTGFLNPNLQLRFIAVNLANNSELSARLVGSDQVTRVSVLKVEATGLTPVKFAQANRIRAGERAFSVGVPFGMTKTVTDGIVSAIGREATDGSPFIQTSVLINPGVDGGPLFNFRGELIGMNSQIHTSLNSGSPNIYFAVPVDVVQRVYEEIKATGKVSRGKIGVELNYDEVVKPIDSMMKRPPPQGAYVTGVTAGGAADKAGIQTNDVIRRVNSTVIANREQLVRVIRELRPGHKITIELVRDDKPLQLEVTIE